MTELIKFPFQIAGNGTVATQDDGDPAYYAAELAAMIGTIPGERELVPTYGVEDLAFDDTPILSVAAQVEKFGPPVEITGVDITQVTENQANITVTFGPLTVDTGDADVVLG